MGLSLLVLALLLGVFWMAHGFTDLFVAIGNADLLGRGWLVLTGILSIVAGAIVVLYPGISLYTLTIVLAVWLIVLGVMAVVRAWQIRSATHALQSPGPAAA